MMMAGSRKPKEKKSQHALALAGLRELIRRRRPPAVRPFYSNFDWLDYGLILLVN
jgi:hypothetical protein